MIKVRKGTFETNSSSTHSLAICDKDTFEKWDSTKGEVYYDRYSHDFLPRAEVEKRFEKRNTDPKYTYKYDDLEDYTHNNGLYKSYSDYLDDIDFETFYETYTTKSGDEVVAFGYYGYDG